MYDKISKTFNSIGTRIQLVDNLLSKIWEINIRWNVLRERMTFAWLKRFTTSQFPFSKLHITYSLDYILHISSFTMGKPFMEQVCIPGGCVPPACWPFPVLVSEGICLLGGGIAFWERVSTFLWHCGNADPPVNRQTPMETIPSPCSPILRMLAVISM